MSSAKVSIENMRMLKPMLPSCESLLELNEFTLAAA
jgi:hypothetical protein